MTFYTAYDPRTGEPLGRRFEDAGPSEVAAAVEAAEAAFEETRHYSSRRLSELLLAVASELESGAAEIVAVADRETGLGQARLQGELVRTAGQFRLFAGVCSEGSYLEPVIDHPRPEAAPPAPDLRRRLVPLGPVAVFGASNFPLAFSAPGGDTASALAAGCPVVFKAHPSHPETSELAAAAIRSGLSAAGAPESMFQLVHGRGAGVGRALVLHPAIRAVAFTGSLSGGRALYDLGSGRADPIPVYAEMGSANPLFVTAGALEARLAAIAEGFFNSITLGTGQFCTKPGLAFVPDTEAGRRWLDEVAERARTAAPGWLLNETTRTALASKVGEVRALPGVELVAAAPADGGPGYRYPATLLAVGAEAFRRSPELAEELFGPVTMVVRYGAATELLDLARRLPGSLTATVHAELDEVGALAELVSFLERRAGRLIWNGFPTGVTVTHAMVHAGPYPATTPPYATSVGSAAVKRFLRPVAYQGFPEELLPAEVREGNPLGILRLVDGRWSAPPA